MKTLPAAEHGVAGEADEPEEQADAVGGVPGRGERHETGPTSSPSPGSTTGAPSSSAALRVIGVRVRQHHPLDAAVDGPPDGARGARDRARARDPRPSRPTTYVFVPSSVSGDGFVGANARDTLRIGVVNQHSGLSSGVSSPELGSQLNSGDAAREQAGVWHWRWPRWRWSWSSTSRSAPFALLIQLLLVGPLIAATRRDRAADRGRRLVTRGARVDPAGRRDRTRSAATRHLVALAVLVGGRHAGGDHRPPPRRARARRAPGSAPSTGWRAYHRRRDNFDEAAPRLLAAIARALGRSSPSSGPWTRATACSAASRTGARTASTRRPSSAASAEFAFAPAARASRAGVGERHAALARRRRSPAGTFYRDKEAAGGRPSRRHGVPDPRGRRAHRRDRAVLTRGPRARPRALRAHGGARAPDRRVRRGACAPSRPCARARRTSAPWSSPRSTAVITIDHEGT